MNKISLTIDKSEVLRYLGYRGGEVEAPLDKKIDECILHAVDSAQPRYVYAYFDIAAGDPITLTRARVTLTGADIQKHLHGCAGCYLLAATLGAQVEREIMRMQHADMTGAVIMDAACDDLIEKLCDRAQSEIREACAKDGRFITDRYSPGYGDLPIGLQRDFLLALNAQRRIGLTASEFDVLMPRKSVTAVIGVSAEPTERRPADCRTCSLYETCNYRKGGGRCGRQKENS